MTVGDAGNAADTTAGYGAVAYEYNIARNETTISQYAAFLNAAAASDPYGLWTSGMSTDLNSAGISRSGSSGSYTYSVIGSGDRPITYVSWFDAARFVNWLHNGQGAGSTETGVYNLNGATSGIFTAQVGATVWLPTEDEWYKAAYYDPTKNAGAGGYWLHANRSDSMTSNLIGAVGAANYYDGDFAVTQSGSLSSGQNYLTDVGAYGTGSQSYYGTNDQAGNVREWNDAVISGSSRGQRGGYWVNPESTLRSSVRVGNNPTFQNDAVGFRIAGAPVPIPEPSTLFLTVLFGAGCLCRRKR